MGALKPCPFCGSSNLAEEATGGLEIAGVIHQHCWIECRNCEAEGPSIEITDETGSVNYSAVRIAWNTRAPQQEGE